ncbi:YkvA family protein [Hyphomonas sp. NPDC076900]|uniref:YkvA family protein n=1 Tax=unclassified Hyphomonas TaxID=2630699 RepID=UPI003CFEBEE1
MSDAAEIINTVKGEGDIYLPKTIQRNERLARGLVPKLARLAGKLPFADDLAAAYYAARDPLTPVKAKAVLFGAAAYFVMPADLVPDVVVGLGFTDDATVLATALSVVGMHVKERHRALARKLLSLPEPVKDPG